MESGEGRTCGVVLRKAAACAQPIPSLLYKISNTYVYIYNIIDIKEY